MFNFIAYFRNIAISLKDILHTDSDKHFHRISAIQELEEFIAASRSISGYQLLVLDKYNGKLDDSSSSDNLHDRHFHTFYILKKATSGDFYDIEAAKLGCYTVARKIMSQMFKDKWDLLFGLRNLERSSFTYSSIGPLAHGYYGIMVSFSSLNPAGIIYNANDWL